MSQSVWPAQQYVRKVTELKASDNDLQGGFLMSTVTTFIDFDGSEEIVVVIN